LLEVSYRFLMLQETALLAGIPLNQETQARVSMLSPNIELLTTRFRQRVTALSYAIATTPPPKSPEGRRELQGLNLELHKLFLQAGYLDLARDRLQLVLDSGDVTDLPKEQRAQYQQLLEQLTQRVKQIEENLFEIQVERQAGPIEKAQYARTQGAPGIAITELEEADRGNMSPVVVRPQLVDLYCNTGQPDKAIDLLSMGASDDPNLGAEPGMSFLRQGQVYILLGNYLSASSLWQERAIPRLRYDRSMRALTLGQTMGRGELISVVNTAGMLPTLITRQAFWEYELAQCLLESGAPDRAAEHFTNALKLVPEMPLRPIISYYLSKMGRPVPELPANAATAAARPASAAAALLAKPLASDLPLIPSPAPASGAPGTSPASAKPAVVPKSEAPAATKEAPKPVTPAKAEDTKAKK
jgi:tetratricopeptide (TPR) repeat protein